MKKYGIVTDSTAYFSKEDLKKFDIYQASLNIIDKDESFKELDVDNKFVRDKINSGHRLTTSQPAPGEFLEIYEDLLKKGYERIFVVTLSKPLSGTYQSAKLAQNMLEDQSKVHVFESKMAAFGNEMLIERIYDLMVLDTEFEDIITQVTKLNSNSHLAITVEDLISLFKSGRVSKTKAAIGTVLRVKPILNMEDGKLLIYKSVRSHKKVIAEMLELMKSTTKGYKKLFVRVQSKNNLEQANQIVDMVKEAFKDAAITFNDYIGPVFSVHIGPKGYGVAWCWE